MVFCDLLLGGSQKALMTNKLIWVLERLAYMEFLKERNTLLTIFFTVKITRWDCVYLLMEWSY